jgi:hypothetical protein
MSMHRYQNSTGGRWGFLSLAPSLAVGKKKGLDLVGWSLDEAVEYRTIASFGNAHPPRTLDGGTLGFLLFLNPLHLEGGGHVRLPCRCSERWVLLCVGGAARDCARRDGRPVGVGDSGTDAPDFDRSLFPRGWYI